MFFVILYLSSIVAANLAIAYFGPLYGPYAAITIGFVFIGLDLTVRDYLHEAWQHKGLVWKMGILIASGSLISSILNPDSIKIAIASFVAFAAAGVADAIIYHLLKDKARTLRVNGSNVVSSGVDSLLFPTIAFGALMPGIVVGQFAAKVLGGGFWFFIINYFRKSRVENTAS